MNLLGYSGFYFYGLIGVWDALRELLRRIRHLSGEMDIIVSKSNDEHVYKAVRKEGAIFNLSPNIMPTSLQAMARHRLIIQIFSPSLYSSKQLANLTICLKRLSRLLTYFF